RDQADCSDARVEREHGQGPSQPRHAKDASAIRGRSGANGGRSRPLHHDAIAIGRRIADHLRRGDRAYPRVAAWRLAPARESRNPPRSYFHISLRRSRNEAKAVLEWRAKPKS